MFAYDQTFPQEDLLVQLELAMLIGDEIASPAAFDLLDHTTKGAIKVTTKMMARMMAKILIAFLLNMISSIFSITQGVLL